MKPYSGKFILADKYVNTIDKVIRLQFTKLVNYYGDQLCEEWGGDFLNHFELGKIQEGFENFRDWFYTSQDAPAFIWINRCYKNKPWGPTTCLLSGQHDPELWDKYEPYLGCGERVLAIKDASIVLCVPRAELLALKLNLLLDHLVIGEALQRMLHPKTQWFNLT